MKKIILISLIAGIFIIPIFSQDTTGKGSLKGLITDALTGAPIEGVIVKLYCIRATAFKKPDTKTNKDGIWKAVFLRGGRWNLDFDKTGYEPVKLSTEVLTLPGSKKVLMKVKMKKLEGPALDQNIVKEIETTQNLYVKGKYKIALKGFQEIKDKYKDQSGIAILNLYIGNCYTGLEKYAEAIKMFKEALKKYPKHNGIINSIGESYMNLNKQEDALVWFQKLSAKDITNPDSLYNLGVVYYNKFTKDGYTKASSFFKKATEQKPDYAQAFYQLGMTYVAMNKTTPALEALRKFLVLAPGHKNAATAKAIIDAYSNQK